MARRLHEAEFVSWVVYITLNGKFEAFSIRFLIVELSNMSTKNVQDASLAPDQMLTGSQYRATWSFRFGLNILQNGTGTDVEDGGAGVGGTDVEDALQNIFLQKKPDRVSNIEARYTVAALSAACNASPDPNARTLPVVGYIQLINARICLFDLDRWVPNAEWTPVLGRLTDYPPIMLITRNIMIQKRTLPCISTNKFTERQPLAKEGAASQKRAR